MATTAKICGLKTPEAVAAALTGKASHIGFVLFDKSPRAIDAETAARLAAPARDRAKVAALLVDPDDALAVQTATVLKPDFIQLHGRESPRRAAEIRALTGLATIKAVGVSDGADVMTALGYEGAADHLMFDAKPPKDVERPGGHGAAFDWALLKDVRPARPWFLAGGLDPWNVAEAIDISRAPIVDVSSGVERGPGLKDPSLIAAFLDAVRRA